MEKSLKGIQTVAKVAKILSKIGYIFCLIGTIGCLLGIVGLAATQGAPFFAGDSELAQMIQSKTSYGYMDAMCSVVAGLVVCALSGVICKMSARYFTNELAAGTPFTFEGAQEIKRLGIWSLALSIAASVVSAIIYGIFESLYGLSDEFSFDVEISLGLGLVYLFLYLVFNYGAGLREKAGEDTANNQYME